jgi:hypothetical protein
MSWLLRGFRNGETENPLNYRSTMLNKYKQFIVSIGAIALPVVRHENRSTIVKKKTDIGEFCDTLSIYFDLRLRSTYIGRF